MNVLGISPLDKDATASLVVDGKVVFAAAEERFSRKKFHSGFPYASVEAALKWAGLGPKDLHAVAYAFYDAPGEARLMRRAVARSRRADWQVLPTPLADEADLTDAARQVLHDLRRAIARNRQP